MLPVCSTVIMRAQSQNSRSLRWWELCQNLKRPGRLEVLYISDIQSLTSPASLCLLSGASVSFSLPVCLFFSPSPCWLCHRLHSAYFSQSCTQMFSSVFNFTVSHINPNKHTNLCFLPHAFPTAMMQAAVDWLFLQMINSSYVFFFYGASQMSTELRASLWLSAVWWGQNWIP